jgi:hypothetical protein
MPNEDDNEPGPSGYRRKENKDNDKQQTVLGAENQKYRAKTQRRKHLTPTYDGSSKYKLPARLAKAQPSHSVRRIVTPSSTPRIREKRTRLIIHEPEPFRSSYHHLDAVDYYYRSTAYGIRHRDDIGHLKHHHKDRVKPPKPTYRPRQSCKNCLEPISSCICILGIERPPKSDWTVILSHRPERPWGFHKSRLEWLEKLERQSKKINIEKLADKKFNIRNEICCFPFTTFWLFFKRDIECFDYYRKEK